MIGVGMGDDNQVDIAIPEGDFPAQMVLQDGGISAAVDQDLPAAGGLDEGGVTLPHVEEGHVKPAVGLVQGPGEGQDCNHSAASQGQAPGDVLA